jgi:energy-coupling factor transport system permease protein
MRVPVPFGQYAPGDSAVHRMDPRAKLGVLAAYTALLFVSSSWAGLGAAAALMALAVLVSGVPLRLVARGVRPVAFILVVTVALNALQWGVAADSLLTIGPVSLSAAGLRDGLFFASRIVLLVMATSVLTLTTSPVALTDALSRLLSPLERVGFPATDVAMMLSVALRFIPTTAEEAERIIVAQTARGARFGEGGPVARSRAYIPVLVPLFVSLFRRADDLALAMDARCYRGFGRTHLRESTMHAYDWVALVGTGLLAGIVWVYL